VNCLANFIDLSAVASVARRLDPNAVVAIAVNWKRLLPPTTLVRVNLTPKVYTIARLTWSAVAEARNELATPLLQSPRDTTASSSTFRVVKARIHSTQPLKKSGVAGFVPHPLPPHSKFSFKNSVLSSIRAARCASVEAEARRGMHFSRNSPPCHCVSSVSSGERSHTHYGMLVKQQPVLLLFVSFVTFCEFFFLADIPSNRCTPRC
jgi:hypothetical protein